MNRGVDKVKKTNKGWRNTQRPVKQEAVIAISIYQKKEYSTMRLAGIIFCHEVTLGQLGTLPSTLSCPK